MGFFDAGIGGVLGGIASVAGSIYNAKATEKANRESLKAQKEENALDRQFNAQQATLAYDRSVEQWNRENSYNSPSALMSRLTDAGLNPNLAYGDISGMAASAPSVSSASHSGSVSPNVPPTIDAAGLSQSLSQIDLIKAQTEKIKSETDLNKIDAQFRAQIHQGTIESQSSVIRLNSASANFKEQEVLKIAPEIQKLQSECDNLIKLGENLSSQTDLTKLESDYQKVVNSFALPKFEADLKVSYAQAKKDNATANLTYQQYKESVQTLGLRMAIMFAQENNIRADTMSKLQSTAESVARENNLDLSSEAIRLGNISLAISNAKADIDLTDAERFRDLAKYTPGLSHILSYVTHYLGGSLGGLSVAKVIK